MAKKRIKKEVIKAFKRIKNGVLKEYSVGDSYISYHSDSIEYLKQIKLIK